MARTQIIKTKSLPVANGLFLCTQTKRYFSNEEWALWDKSGFVAALWENGAKACQEERSLTFAPTYSINRKEFDKFLSHLKSITSKTDTLITQFGSTPKTAQRTHARYASLLKDFYSKYPSVYTFITHKAGNRYYLNIDLIPHAKEDFKRVISFLNYFTKLHGRIKTSILGAPSKTLAFTAREQKAISSAIKEGHPRAIIAGTICEGRNIPLSKEGQMWPRLKKSIQRYVRRNKL